MIYRWTAASARAFCECMWNGCSRRPDPLPTPHPPHPPIISTMRKHIPMANYTLNCLPYIAQAFKHFNTHAKWEEVEKRGSPHPRAWSGINVRNQSDALLLFGHMKHNIFPQIPTSTTQAPIQPNSNSISTRPKVKPFRLGALACLLYSFAIDTRAHRTPALHC